MPLEHHAVKIAKDVNEEKDEIRNYFHEKSHYYDINFQKYKNVKEISKEMKALTTKAQKHPYKPLCPRNHYSFFNEEKGTTFSSDLWKICKEKGKQRKQDDLIKADS